MERKYKETVLGTWARKSWVSDWYRSCRACGREVRAYLRNQLVAVPSVAQLAESIAVLRTSAVDPDETDSQAPIFLLCTGWRAGSTLLQRILVTDPTLLLWGEPLSEMTLVPRIAEMVSHSLSPRDLGLWYDQRELTSYLLPTTWIASLSPPGDDFRLALRRLFD